MACALGPTVPKRHAGVALLIAVTATASGCGGDGGEGRIDDYIRDDTATRLVLEVDRVAGLDVRDSVVTDLEDGFGDILDKPDGVEVRMDATLEPRGADYLWSRSEVRDLGSSTFDMPVEKSTVKMHVMLLDGRLAAEDGGPTQNVGLAWNHTHFAVFDQLFEENCSAAPVSEEVRQRLCTAVERTIWTHEMGHLIGLVNLGLPMVVDHEDPDHPGHARNPDSVMFWRIERSAIEYALDRMADMPRPNLGFGERCLQDIAALRDERR